MFFRTQNFYNEPEGNKTQRRGTFVQKDFAETRENNPPLKSDVFVPDHSMRYTDVGFTVYIYIYICMKLVFVQRSIVNRYTSLALELHSH